MSWKISGRLKTFRLKSLAMPSDKSLFVSFSKNKHPSQTLCWKVAVEPIKYEESGKIHKNLASTQADNS